MSARALAARFVRREPGVGEAPELAELPPHSVEAEQAVLGAAMIAPDAWTIVSEILPAGDFYRVDHRVIFGAIERVTHEDGRADVLTVAEELKTRGELESCGGLPYLQSLERGCAGTVNVRRYAEIVRDRARKRELMAFGEDLAAKASAPGADLEALRADGEKALAEIPRRAERTQPLDLRDLAGRTPPERIWALLYWIVMGHAHLLIGPGGIGKSTLLMQLFACLALARRFIDDVPEPLKVLLWLCEDDRDEIWRRLVAIAKWLDVPLDAFADNLVIVPRHGCENVLFTNEGGRLRFTPTFNELRTQALDLGAHVVGLDNIAHIFGADENKRHDVTMFLNGLAGAMPGRALVLAGHPSRSEGSEFSGSSAWEAAVRVRLFLGRTLPDQKPDDDDQGDETVRYLARRKANYSARDWRRFTFADGVLVPDEVEAAGGMVGVLRDRAAEKVIVDGIKTLHGMSLWPSESSNSARYLPRLLLEYKLAGNCSKRELTEAMRRLMLEGALVVGTVSHYSNRNPMPGLKVAE